MSITAAVFFLIYFTGLIMTFRRPVYGVFTYLFEWHNHPPYFWWGDELPDLRWSYTIALATLISWLIHRAKQEPLEKPDYRPAIWVILMVLNMYLVSFLYAVLPGASYEKAFEVLKVVINFLLMVSIIRNHEDYRKMIWVMILCLGYWGWISFNEGSNRDIGMVAPNATEENAVSAHVVALLPFIGMYFLTSKKKLAKIATLLMIPFLFNLIILANSRASFLGLLVIGFFSIFLVKGKAKFAVIVGLIAGAFIFNSLTNEQFKERQTMETYDDGSATSRLHIWSGAYRMWKDHPFGVGGRGFAELSTDYIPEIEDDKTQHNTFVAVLTDWGFIGLTLYLGFLAHIFFLSIKTKRQAKRIPALKIFSLEMTAVQLGLLGICVAGIFHSRQYAESVTWLSSFVIMINNIQRTEIARLQKEAKQEISLSVEEDVPAIPGTVTK
jgi:probable O-glycosylation ligase (exosortase A-associated)